MPMITVRFHTTDEDRQAADDARPRDRVRRAFRDRKEVSPEVGDVCGARPVFLPFIKGTPIHDEPKNAYQQWDGI